MNRYKWMGVTLLLFAVVAGSYTWWRHVLRYPSTSDAYTDAHVVRIASQVNGKVLTLHVNDHQHVTGGEILLEIDPQPFQIRVTSAEANLELAQQQQVESEDAVKIARANVAQHEVLRQDAKRNNDRLQSLLRKNSVSASLADSARFKLEEMTAALKAARSELQQALQRQAESDAGIRLAQAQMKQAQLDLSHTRIVAPASGTVGDLSLRPGNIVESGQALFPLVEDNQFWVNANFKETDLQRIRENQPATVVVDMYPDKTFRGVVESISPASGTAFALLPAENATGNWVKVTQRFPVRVRILEKDPQRPLRVGASSMVTVDTTVTAG